MSSRLISSALFALALCSCGGDEGGTTPPPAPTVAEKACAAVADRVAGCGTASACEQALAHDCASVAGMLGDPYLRALEACIEGGGDPASCALAAGAGLTPTGAQHAFAESFCKNCALGVPGCVDILFDGTNADLAPVAAMIAPLSDDLVSEITAECTKGLTCLATFQNCAEGVIAKRAIPEEALGCFVKMVLGTEPGSADCGQGGAGAGGAGAAGGDGGGGAVGAGAGGTGGSGGGGGMGCKPDPLEPNETLQDAKMVDGGGDGILSDCEGDESLSAVLAGSGDPDWFRYNGSDGPCGLDDIQPHASVVAATPVQVCVYLDPVNGSAPPTCTTGNPASQGTYVGCCGEAEARLAFGSNLQNDDADVRISVTAPGDVCVDYTLTYGFGKGP